MRRAENSWVETSCIEWRSWEELKGEEFRWAEKRWEKLRWHEKRWEQMRSTEKSWDELRRGEKTWDEMRWDEMRWGEKGWEDTARHEMRWCHGIGQDEVRWDEMRWADMRWDQMMRRDEQWKEMSQEWYVKTCQEIFAAKHRRLAHTLQAHSLFRSSGYRRFNFETSAPGLPGYYLQRQPQKWGVNDLEPKPYWLCMIESVIWVCRPTNINERFGGFTIKNAAM